MGASSYVQSNFSGGEWSLRAQGRYDRPDYRTAMTLCRNALPVEESSWSRRPGTVAIAPTFKGLPAKLLTYSFTEHAPYQMEFTDNTLRFIDGLSFVVDSTATVISVVDGASAVFALSAAVTWATGAAFFSRNCAMARAG